MSYWSTLEECHQRGAEPAGARELPRLMKHRPAPCVDVDSVVALACSMTPRYKLYGEGQFNCQDFTALMFALGAR